MTRRRIAPQLIPVLASLVAACAPTAPTPAPSTVVVAPDAPSAGAATPFPAGPPEGTIAFSTELGGNADVFLLELGPELLRTRLTAETADEFDPALSPDGKWIAFRVAEGPGTDDADIWLMDRAGRRRVNLTRSPGVADWAPVWTPDGRIAFTSDRDGTLELWSMRSDGTDTRKLADGWCEYAAPAPDATRFACAAPRGGTYDLAVVDVVTGARERLTDTAMTEFGPAWSPDGRWIAFSRDLGERWALLVVHPDGTGEREIAHEGVFPAWTPDGRLAWTGPGGINVLAVDGGGRLVIDQDAQFVSWSR